jgi:hypothetical protein
MRVGIERRESVDAKQGRQQESLKAAPQRLLPVRQQGKVVIGMRGLMGQPFQGSISKPLILNALFSLDKFVL